MRSILKSVAYGVMDVCTAGRGVKRVISGQPIRFPARWSRYYPSEYDPPKFAFLRAHCRPGDVVLDVGAHIGLFSILMARLVGPTGRVFSFEPTPLTRQVLEQTVRLNGCEEVVEVRAEAVAGSSGTAVLYDTGDALSNANSLVHGLRSVLEIPVKTVTMDEFVAARALEVRCIKVDVEGAELEVLAGAARTIRNSRPAVELELHPAALKQSGRTLAEGWDLFQEYGLAVYHEGRPINREWLCRRREAVDVQLLPQEHASGFARRS